MVKTLDYHLAEIFIKATKERDQKEVIRSYNHFKRRNEDLVMLDYMNIFYVNYFRSKYDYWRIKWKRGISREI